MTMPSTPTWVDILTPTQCPCCGQAVMPTPQDYLDAFTNSIDQFTSSMSQWMGDTGGMTTASGAAGVRHGDTQAYAATAWSNGRPWPDPNVRLGPTAANGPVCRWLQPGAPVSVGLWVRMPRQRR